MTDASVKAVVGALRWQERDLPIVASVFTPYQLLFLERIWSLLPPRPILILDGRPAHFRAGRAPRIAHAHVEAFDLTGKVNDPEQARLVRHGIAVAEAFAGDRPFAFLCGSYQWPINTVFYTRQRRNPCCKLFLIEEGLSSYLNVRASARERLRNLAREAVARLRGYPPRAMIPGHPLGHDIAQLKGIVLGVDRPPPSKRPRPYVLLPRTDDTGVQYNPNAAILVGQPYLNELGPEGLARIIAEIHADLAGRGFSWIAFKPHHYQTETELAIYRAQGFAVIDPPVTVEEMIATSDFRTVAGINSTALLTVKSLFGDGVRAIAYDPSRIVPRHEGRDAAMVEALFRDAGVEIVALEADGHAA